MARGSEDGLRREQTLDQILNQDAIPPNPRSYNVPSKKVLNQQTSILERWFISLNEPLGQPSRTRWCWALGLPQMI